MRKVLLFLSVIVSMPLIGQDLPKVDAVFDEMSLIEIFSQLENKTDYTFYYDSKLEDNWKISAEVSGTPIDQLLTQMLDTMHLNFFINSNSIFITENIKIIDKPPLYYSIKKKEAKTESNTTTIQKGILFSQEYLDDTQTEQDRVVEIGNRKYLDSNQPVTIAGHVLDGETGMPLTGVFLHTEDYKFATSTDVDGFYSLSLPSGKNSIIIRYVGMKTIEKIVILFSDGQLNLEMEVDAIALQEVVVSADRDDNIEGVMTGVEKINVAEVKNVPLVLGESDIMKVATTFAGVQTIGEGASGFNVRGGKSDQNLVLLNGATIYNASHFFGFFSVFNSDAIQDMEVYKSGIPAHFGGRLSSVFDIEAKKASNTVFQAKGGVSLVTSKLTMDIPIINEKAGLMIGGRTTYSNWLLSEIGNADFSENEVSFYDLIMKYDHEINDHNDFQMSGYYSKDKFRLSSDTIFSFSNFSFRNASASSKWTHRFNDNFEGNLTTAYSSYDYELSYDESPSNAFYQDFKIDEIGSGLHLSYYIDNVHTIKSGVEFKKYSINPGSKKPYGESSTVAGLSLEREQARETSIYLSDEYVPSDRWTLYGGLRQTLFTTVGEKTVSLYQPDSPKNGDTRTGSIAIEEGEKVSRYHGPELRLGAKYSIGKNSSIKASYNRTRQYIHALTNSASLSPTDIWRLSSTYIKPQIADQYSLGFYKNLSQNSIETSIEGYYKDIQNLIDFKVGSQFLLNQNIETVALQGPGKSYGLELSLKKKGKLNGWINYAFARTFVKLDSEFAEERINEGAYYPANSDMPHTLNVVANYKVTERLSFSTSLVYRSGRPITYPVGAYSFKGIDAVHYSDRNVFRIPDYKRVDIGINLESSHNKRKKIESFWSFSIYNLLGTDNPFSVFFDVRDGEVNGYQLVVFPSAIPTVTYNFKF